MARDMKKSSRSLTARQRARRRAKETAALERQRVERLEKALEEFLVGVEQHHDALVATGQAAQVLLDLGESEKSILAKTGVEQADLRRAIKLAKEADKNEVEYEAPEQEEQSPELVESSEF